MNAETAHAKALAMITKKDHGVSRGVPTLFSRDVPVLDAFGNQTGATVTRSVLVHCVDNYTSGDPAEYVRLQLSESEAPAVFGVPAVLGEEPDPMMTASWNAAPHTLRSMKPFRLNSASGQVKTVTMVMILQA